ncbi:hypothetical protein AYL99_01730 [Fonsecaea erecta]|uniref:C2H2-type domain-containing protein n=1 Tax=Fonsecaea erecta TaxID=1367422 RepID=A0A179A0X5_9EURO|nr:hypothetical protein AYL99_01730 [Fonsecaea erecta]OAP65758.1 hypothetical protein AYL99_01730 [Fonsecaea erecta]
MKIKCTYEECPKRFDTHQAMIRHKERDPNHSYCKRCDIDCQDDMFLFIHQLGSPAHICCPICGCEFKSSAARDNHMEIQHHSTQNIECAGCGQKCGSASELMQHIERDECEVIKLQDFQMQRAERQIQKDAWDTETDPFAINSRTREQTSAAINDNAQLDRLDLATYDSGRSLSNALGGPIHVASHEQFPSLGQSQVSKAVNASAALEGYSLRVKPASNLIDLDDPPMKGMSKLHLSQPDRGLQQKFGTQREETTSGMVKGWLDSLTTQAEPPSDDSIEVASMYDRKVSSDNTGQIPPTSLAKPNPDAPHEHIVHMPAASMVSTGSPLDIEKYWDANRQVYSCPTIRCKRQFRTLADFKAHLLTSAHVGSQVTCPSCLKKFASTSAWVAHTSSASKRCDIRHSANFNQIMREFTGGLLGTQGYNDNGTVRFVAPKIEDW